MAKILIYQDYTYNNGSLFKALSKNPHVTDLGFTDADDIKNGILDPSVTAFIMPGGASRYAAAKLDGLGNRMIRAYVAGGGLYIGICAGAYYACRNIEWRKGHPDQMLIENELGFYPATASGPAPNFQPAEIVKLALDDGRSVNCFYWSGPLFRAPEPDVDILARYASLPDQPPAIISGRHGDGRYLLLSPHLEFDSAQLDLLRFNVVENRHAEIAAMPTIDGLSLDLFHDMMNRFIA